MHQVIYISYNDMLYQYGDNRIPEASAFRQHPTRKTYIIQRVIVITYLSQRLYISVCGHVYYLGVLLQQLYLRRKLHLSCLCVSAYIKQYNTQLNSKCNIPRSSTWHVKLRINSIRVVIVHYSQRVVYCTFPTV